MNAQQTKALDELRKKTLNDIQRETAYTWAYRAWAAQQLGLPADSIEYAHEAIEHAALCGDDSVLADVRAISGHVIGE